MSAGKAQMLRERIRTGSQALLLPGAPNALTARLAEEVGFEALYISGAGVTNSFLGAPDIGLLTVTELAEHVRAVREAVTLPLVVDADTGFGNALNVGRTVRTLERAGADAIQLEDQVTPKRCGHFSGKQVVPVETMVGKVMAATDARLDDSLLVIARTDARAEHGLDEACRRAARYLDAGADVAFVEAPRDEQELRAIPRRVPGPHIVNMVEGGLTPPLGLDELSAMGYSVVLYANTAMRAAIAAMRTALTHLHEHGDTRDVLDLLATWQERQDLVRKPAFDDLDARYGAVEDRA